MAKARPPAITARHIRNLLRARYADEQQWALAFEVRNSTGAVVGERYADAVAMHLWPSRGFAIHGFEIKTSRADWLRELENPKKADPVLVHCDYWWVVAPRKIINVSELPIGWGFLAASTQRLTIVEDAPKRIEGEDADVMYRGFAASLLLRHTADDKVFKEAVANVRKSYRKQLARELEDQRQRLRDQDGNDSIRRFKKAFEEAFDEELWSPDEAQGRRAAERVRRAYALVRRLESPYGDLEGIRRKISSLRADVEAIAKLFKADENSETA